MIGEDGQFVNIGEVRGLSPTYMGDFDDEGNWYVSNGHTMWKIDVSERPLMAEKMTISMAPGA